MPGGSDLEQFLRQPFVGAMFGLMCFLGVLLVIMIGVVVYLRQRRARQAQVSAAPILAASEHDMPDLNLLVSTPSAPQRPEPMVAKADPSAAPPAPPRAARKGTFTLTPQDGGATEAVEVLTVLRDVLDGHLIIQMGDKAYQDVNKNAEFNQRFSRILRELGQMTGQVEQQPAEEPSIEEIEAAEAETDLPPEQPAPPAPPPPRPTAPPPPLPSGRMPGDLPSFKLADNPMIKPKRGQKLDLKPVPEINIAGAIESYLQYKLQHSSDYAGRSVHIYPAPDGGVSIEVDGQYYDAVSDITDVSIREFIAQAIQEWQERH